MTHCKLDAAVKKPVTDRCTGHCCKKFFLPLSPDELKQRYESWQRRGRSPILPTLSERLLPMKYALPEEIWLVYPMVRHLGTTEEVQPPHTVGNIDNHPGHFYTCKHYDAKSGDCTIYDIRPKMCADYPYSGFCQYADCTWEARKLREDGPTEISLGNESEITISE